MDETTLYQRADVQRLDAAAIDDHGIAGYTLMQRAGAGAFAVLRQHWPAPKRVLVVAGGGNNGGDGFDVALRCQQAGLAVTVALLADSQRIRGAARQALDAWTAAGGVCVEFDPDAVAAADVVVDALLGIGLDRPVEGPRAEAIAAMNRSGRPVLAIDIPSGLDGDTGRVLGVAVVATHTVSFIGLKLGLFQGSAPSHCGQVHFVDCGVPAAVYDTVSPAAQRLQPSVMHAAMSPRAAESHKGDFGHVAIIGGQPGMPGAVLMAARAALRSGVGRVSLITHPDHAAMMPLAQAELMTHAWQDGDSLRGGLESVTALVVGPGLGQGAWGWQVLQQAIDAVDARPLILDADALNLVADAGEPLPPHTVLTPHPGEAARLLGWTTAEVQADRLTALMALADRYDCTVVLKGAGTWIGTPDALPWLCSLGNPGMAVGGMGDVLAGMIGALAAGPLPIDVAARIGVVAHAMAGDQAAQTLGQTAMTPSDLITALSSVWPRP